MNMEPVHLFEELQKCEENSLILKKLLNFASSNNHSLESGNLKEWQPILAYIMGIFIDNTKIEREQMLLASHAFFALLSMQSTDTQLEDVFDCLLKLNSKQLCYFDKTYNIAEPELFKLTCAHGYLQTNHKRLYSNRACLVMFDVICTNCIKYTKYSYFAYRVLCMWLNRTMKTNFWSECDLIVEEKLETIIFSNWCNAINEISKQNCGSIFNMYLQIMGAKYDGFLQFIFDSCVNNASWQNETKYDILAEIFEVCNNVKGMFSRDFLLSLCTSLTKNYLRCAGTKVYIAITKKLSEDEWKASFGDVMRFLFKHWETLEITNDSPVQLLCKYWLQPTVKKHRNILPYLWELTIDLDGCLLRSHLQRMASEMRIQLPQESDVEYYINHKDEIVRLNGFAICCNRVNTSTGMEQQFRAVKDFLWHNAICTTVYIREGIVKYFKIFYANLLRMCDTNPNAIEVAYDITRWLHEFLLDCLEIGSCYQRKILGLNLYRALLSFTNGSALGKSNNMENAHYAMLLEKHLKSTGHWTFTDKKSLFVLLKLILDSSGDIKQLASCIILNSFDKTALNDSEKRVLYNVALEHCNSSKFYKIESGTALITLLANWMPLKDLQSKDAILCNSNVGNIINPLKYSDFLFNEAKEQLVQMKQDILKAIVQNKPFYGALMALLKVAFQNGPEKCHLTVEFLEKILCLLKDATDFLLSVLSSKSKNTEHSSSFEEMGLAIDEAIKTSAIGDGNYDELSLTPAHQVLISCIWMSLKVSCEMACEVGMLMCSDETVERSANIIVTVLFRCRHKGVVESAGTAIGNLTRALCKDVKYSNLPRTHILSILKNDSEKSLNITRRGAGLTIMFHKIVVSDNRRDRPLLHFAVQLLLELLDEGTETSQKQAMKSQEHDSPWARRLHFLRALVADKEIHAQLIPYMERICLTCFRYLESETWTIRNASLQLFGAIVPRLVGQSFGDASLDYGTGYNINHFITHYPVLAEYIMKELESFASKFASFSTALYRHSSIIPILILLSKFSCSGCDFIDYSSQLFVQNAKRLLYVLFDDPVLYVRLLAAKAYVALTPFSRIEHEFAKLEACVFSCRSANMIHGHLLAMKCLKEKLSIEMENVNPHVKVTQCRGNQSLKRYYNVLKIWDDAGKGIKTRQPCYILETLFLELSYSKSDPVSDIFPLGQSESLLCSQKIQPGFFLFVEYSTKLYAEYVRLTNNIDLATLRELLHSSCPDQNIALLNNLSHCTSILPTIVEHVLSTEDNCEELLLSAMINFVMRTLHHSLCSGIDVPDFKWLIEKLTVKIEKNSSHTKLWKLKCVLILLFSENETVLSELLSHILSICVHEEEHMRQTAVDFLKYTLYRYAKLPDRCKLMVAHSSLILLKDELSEVREAIAKSLRVHVLQEIGIEYNTTLHEEVIYQKLLSEIISSTSWFPFERKTENLHFIKLFTLGIKSLDTNATIENPFYHDDNTFYREESKFLNACFFYIRKSKEYADDIFSAVKRDHRDNKVIDASSILQTKHQLQEKAAFGYMDLQVVLNTKYADYLLRKQGVVIHEYSL